MSHIHPFAKGPLENWSVAMSVIWPIHVKAGAS